VKRASVRARGKGPSGRRATSGEIRLSAPTPKPVMVRHLDAPPPNIRRESIHARRILPRVREGKEREFHSATREIAFFRREAALAPRDATDELVLVTNTELTGPGQQNLASTVGEPSVAVNKDVIMYTGNWYAARSLDAGKTFKYIDPFTTFPDPPNLSFCCDQVLNYLPSIDTFVWLLQYSSKTGPQADNIQRLFAPTSRPNRIHQTVGAP
jgi:hypothetical protein